MIALWLSYVIIPILDYILPHDNYNLPSSDIKNFEKDKRFLIPLYLCWLFDFALYFYVLVLLTIPGRMQDTPFMFVLSAFTTANAGALNLVAGHELVHRKQLHHKILGNLVYSKFMYSHFIIQHIKSHHKKVATPEDPSTARKGESIWAFYWRAIPEGYVETWQLEKERL